MKYRGSDCKGQRHWHCGPGIAVDNRINKESEESGVQKSLVWLVDPADGMNETDVHPSDVSNDRNKQRRSQSGEQ